MSDNGISGRQYAGEGGNTIIRGIDLGSYRRLHGLALDGKLLYVNGKGPAGVAVTPDGKTLVCNLQAGEGGGRPDRRCR